MTKKVCFLFNHEDLHQIAHSLPVAQALAAMKAGFDIEVAVSTSAQEVAVRRFLGSDLNEASIRVKRLDLNIVMEAATTALSRIVPARRIAILARHRDYFKDFDALVVPEFTSTLLRSRWHMAGPKLICIPHGAGDRSVGFSDELRLFDLILVAGEKTRGRILERHPMLEDRVKVCGYPKFDTLDFSRRPRLFDNDLPTVIYNPHFDPRLSSWYRFGRDILDYFAAQRDYNFVFAPHVMLFRKLIHGSMEHRELRWRGQVPKALYRLPHMRIDAGSERSVDMTYTLGGDIYLGDASSQIYEWIIHPRPAIFLNSHAANWQQDPNYAHWALGQVIDTVAQLPAALAASGTTAEPFMAAQQAAASATFDRAEQSASSRCAQAIVEFMS